MSDESRSNLPPETTGKLLCALSEEKEEKSIRENTTG